ncbi:MAG: hypothetical protein Aurels2KO_58240 [Aureliella sp.]
MLPAVVEKVIGEVVLLVVQQGTDLVVKEVVPAREHPLAPTFLHQQREQVVAPAFVFEP